MTLSPFARGLFLGLISGFVVGYLVTSAMPLPSGADGAEVERLRHQLETARRERDGLLGNIDDFQELAERMTRAFGHLEARFLALEKRLAEEARPEGAAD